MNLEQSFRLLSEWMWDNWIGLKMLPCKGLQLRRLIVLRLVNSYYARKMVAKQILNNLKSLKEGFLKF